MKKETIAVYGGSFDPITSGHIDVIRRTLQFVDKVHIVIATNPDKKPLFNLKEKKDIISKHLLEAFDPAETDFNRLSVYELQENTFLATFAREMGASIMIRGIRDNLDFSYEQKLDITNKQIAEDVQTVYVMPTPELSVVSSSWVKSMVGMYGWRKTVKPFISKYTLQMLEEKWLEKQFYDILISAERLGYVSLDPHMKISKWEELRDKYNERRNGYHNLSHVSSMLEDLRHHFRNSGVVYTDNKSRVAAELAVLYHDIEPTEKASADFFKKSLNPFKVEEKHVREYIMATQHSHPENINNAHHAALASADLLSLAKPWEEYCVYYGCVKEEYRDKFGLDYQEFEQKWKEGRQKSLENMLNREKIFPYNMPKHEKFARKNLLRELTEIHHVVWQN